jgi:hypothetical protein
MEKGQGILLQVALSCGAKLGGSDFIPFEVANERQHKVVYSVLSNL